MTMRTTSYFTWMASPIGSLLLVSDGHSVTELRLPGRGVVDPTWCEDRGPFVEVSRQLEAYFDGQSVRFDVPLAPSGTEFQRLVWDELQRIGFGERLSYSALATRIGRPSSARAVGMANARNPIAILIPCHRVVGANGALTGFAGGLDRKHWLLRHEAQAVPADGPRPG